MYRSRAYTNQYVSANHEGGNMGSQRIVILNALPLNMFPSDWDRFTIKVIKATEKDLLHDITDAREVKCYIRHTATVQLLEKLLGLKLQQSSELYKYNPEDKVYIVTLKTPQRGQEATEISVNDIEIYMIVATECLL